MGRHSGCEIGGTDKQFPELWYRIVMVGHMKTPI